MIACYIASAESMAAGVKKYECQANRGDHKALSLGVYAAILLGFFPRRVGLLGVISLRRDAKRTATVMVDSAEAAMIHTSRDSISHCFCRVCNCWDVEEEVPNVLRSLQRFFFGRVSDRLFGLASSSCRIPRDDLIMPRRQAYGLLIQVVICKRNCVRIEENAACWG